MSPSETVHPYGRRPRKGGASGPPKRERKKPGPKPRGEPTKTNPNEDPALTTTPSGAVVPKWKAKYTSPNVTPERMERITEAVRWRLQGLTYEAIAERMGCDLTTITRYFDWVRANAEGRVVAFFQALVGTMPDEFDLVNRERWQLYHRAEEDGDRRLLLLDIEKSLERKVMLGLKTGFIKGVPTRVEVRHDATHRLAEFIYGPEDEEKRAQRDRLLDHRRRFVEEEVVDGVINLPEEEPHDGERRRGRDDTDEDGTEDA